MSSFVLEGAREQAATARIHSLHLRKPSDKLKLNELDLCEVIHAPVDATTCELTTFGSVRETCPKCGRAHLKLVLRQDNVRFAHLFCPACASCFDARYSNGASALTI